MNRQADTLTTNTRNHMKHMDSYLIVIENGKKNYSAFSPDVPGCIATDATLEKTIARMRSALKFHLEAEDAIPEPKGIEWHFREDPELRADQGRLIFAYIPVADVVPALVHA